MSKGNKMSEDILEKQMFEILENKEMPEYIKFAKVDMLVNLGVNINAKDEGETALMKASQNGKIKASRRMKLYFLNSFT